MLMKVSYCLKKCDGRRETFKVSRAIDLKDKHKIIKITAERDNDSTIYPLHLDGLVTKGECTSISTTDV